MARRHRFSERCRSIAGGTLAGFGLYVLFVHFSETVVQLKQLLATPGGAALGIVPSAVLAISQAVQAYVSAHHRLPGLTLMLASFWPVLLVILGTVLLQGVLTDKVEARPLSEKYFQNNRRVCRFRRPSFDV